MTKLRNICRRPSKSEKEIGDKHGEAASNINLGTLFHYLGQHSKAKVYHEKALELSDKIRYIELQFMSHLSLAVDNFLLDGKIYRKLCQTFLKAFKSARKCEFFYEIKTNLRSVFLTNTFLLTRCQVHCFV